jgi:hypothetical protein
MKLYKRFFPAIVQDNELAYFAHLQGVIDSVDELSILEVTKNPTSLHFRLAPSLPKYNELLLQEILKLHNILQIQLSLSKSIKSSAAITFEINLDN